MNWRLSLLVLALCQATTVEALTTQFVSTPEGPRLLVQGTRGQHYTLNIFNDLDDLRKNSGTEFIANGSIETVSFPYSEDENLFATLVPRIGFTSLDATNCSPIARYRVPPTYPRSLRDEPFEGEAIVNFVIQVDGTTADFSPKSYTHLEIYDAAVEALRHWLFEPQKLDGAPVAQRVSINFGLRVRS